MILPALGRDRVGAGHAAALGTVWAALGLTLLELALAFALAAAAGLLAGFVISRSPFAVRVFDPLLAGLYAMPTILLFPLYLLFFGIGPPLEDRARRNDGRSSRSCSARSRGSPR